jgi:nitrilase
MKKIVTVACLQMNSGGEVAANLALANDLLQQAAAGGAQLAALPEFFPLIAADETFKLSIAEKDDDGPIQNFLSRSAATHRMYIVGGTLPIDAGSGRVFSSCLLYGPDGTRLARYDKIHLFRFSGHKQTIDETVTIIPGDTVTVVDTELGRIGLAVCYDLRFPELFRAMEQPDIIIVPSAFTRETGAAHWEVLLRARAVENLAHVLAPAQAGVHLGGRKR